MSEQDKRKKRRIKIGERIKDARYYCKITQQQLGERIPISQSTISEYERGNIDIPIERLFLIAEVTGLDVQFFLDGIKY